jgi:beta-lactamase regulating signal transducer with metallopeptidase domain
MMISALDLQSLAQFSSERILNCGAEGIGIALFAGILLRAVGRQSSGARFAVWFSALLGIAALPLFGHSGSSGADIAKHFAITIPGSWAPYIFGGWAVIAGVGLVRVWIGFWHLTQLRNSCARVEVTALNPLLRKTLEEFDSPRSVAICVSDRLRVPTAMGFLKPLVVIPSWTMLELSTKELNAILLHEFAHLRRWDDWTNLIQKILGALLFFHPAVWWIENKLTLEREMACDDAVLATTTSPRAYAECLVTLAEKSFVHRGLALAQAAVSRVRHISLRVSQILDVNRPAGTRMLQPAPVLLTGALLVCVLAFSYTPNLVSFEKGAAGVPAAPHVAAKSRTDSHVVPARRGVRREAGGSVSAVARLSKPSVIPVKAVQRHAQSPVLVGRIAANDAANFQTLVFVMQTRQYDASGSVVLNLCVWRVTVAAPRRNSAGIVAKSI